jgi:hypothetical protein
MDVLVDTDVLIRRIHPKHRLAYRSLSCLVADDNAHRQDSRARRTLGEASPGFQRHVP